MMMTIFQSGENVKRNRNEWQGNHILDQSYIQNNNEKKAYTNKKREKKKGEGDFSAKTKNETRTND
ncbi:hypothetical protein BCR42DRAFT_428607, partial [Absidia repens]